MIACRIPWWHETDKNWRYIGCGDNQANNTRKGIPHTYPVYFYVHTYRDRNGIRAANLRRRATTYRTYRVVLCGTHHTAVSQIHPCRRKKVRSLWRLAHVGRMLESRGNQLTGVVQARCSALVGFGISWVVAQRSRRLRHGLLVLRHLKTQKQNTDKESKLTRMKLGNALLPVALKQRRIPCPFPPFQQVQRKLQN